MLSTTCWHSSWHFAQQQTQSELPDKAAFCLELRGANWLKVVVKIWIFVFPSKQLSHQNQASINSQRAFLIFSLLGGCKVLFPAACDLRQMAGIFEFSFHLTGCLNTVWNLRYLIFLHMLKIIVLLRLAANQCTLGVSPNLRSQWRFA